MLPLSLLFFFFLDLCLDEPFLDETVGSLNRPPVVSVTFCIACTCPGLMIAFIAFHKLNPCSALLGPLLEVAGWSILWFAMAMDSTTDMAFLTCSDASSPVNPPGGTYPCFLMKWSSRLMFSAAMRRSSTPFSAMEKAFISISERSFSSRSFVFDSSESFLYSSSCLLNSSFKLRSPSFSAAAMSVSPSLYSLMPNVISSSVTSSLKEFSSASWVFTRIFNFCISKSFCIPASARWFSSSYLRIMSSAEKVSVVLDSSFATSSSLLRRSISY
mmetsp:Transcript_9471/g.17136  ORF Transcript_9471/g.17136 Transcript_9471/m.17136 type:complete len:272 (-) Transcript_9471:1686-2501(-)